jgi:4-hydroxy-3-methylbut-2-enyl diphosphate reductase IspH
MLEALFETDHRLESRRIGRTTAGVALAIRTGALYVVHNPEFARQLEAQHPGLSCIALQEHKKFHGQRRPIIWDHHAVGMVVGEALRDQERSLARIQAYQDWVYEVAQIIQSMARASNSAFSRGEKYSHPRYKAAKNYWNGIAGGLDSAVRRMTQKLEQLALRMGEEK